MLVTSTSTTICESQLTDGTRYFFLSMVGMSVLSAFSQITYPRESDHLGDYYPKQTNVLGCGRGTSDGSSRLRPFASLRWNDNNPGQFDTGRGRVGYAPKGCSSLNLDRIVGGVWGVLTGGKEFGGLV